MRKIVIFDVDEADSQFYRRALKNVFGFEVATTRSQLNSASAEKHSDASIVSISPNSQLTKTVIARLPNLELVATRSRCHDHIDTAALQAQKILLSRVSHENPNAVAEYVISLILALRRKLAYAARHIDEGTVNYELLRGSEVAGATLGIVGGNKTTELLVKKARGLDMAVVQCYADETHHHAKQVEVSELLQSSDIVSLHLQLNNQSKQSIDADFLNDMKTGAVLINTSSSELIKAADLVDGLYSGQIGAAGLDGVESSEALTFDHAIERVRTASLHDLRLNAEYRALGRMDNVILTPHSGFNTEESIQLVREDTVENIKHYIMHKPQNLVRL